MSKTIQDAERELGLQPKSPTRRGAVSGCTYNPEHIDDPANDCMADAKWHIKARSDDEHGWASLLGCEGHFATLMAGPYRDTVMDFHEFGPACCLEGTWWMPFEGSASVCMTEEKGLELGLLKYEDPM